MSKVGLELLKAFDALTEAEQDEVRDMLLYGYVDPGPLTDEEIVGAAEELFQMLDAEEEVKDAAG